MRPNSRESPQTRRDSRIEVCTVTSFAASARHCEMVRTLEPISRPVSQQLPMNASTWALSAGSVSGFWSSGSSTSTSTSEWGNNSQRP